MYIFNIYILYIMNRFNYITNYTFMQMKIQVAH